MHPPRRAALIRFPEAHEGLPSARRFNPKWAAVMRVGGASEAEASKVSGCCASGDEYAHHPRSARGMGRPGHRVDCAASAERPAGARARIVRPWYCGDDKTCAIESEQYWRERGAKVARLMRAVARAGRERHGFDVRGIDCEFTVPKPLWPLLTAWENHTAFQKVCYQALLDTFATVHPGLKELFVVSNVHPLSSGRPWQSKPHAHLLGVNVGRFARGALDASGAPRVDAREYGELRYHLSEDSLIALRRNYRRRFEEAFGVALPSNVVVHYSFFKVIYTSRQRWGQLSKEAEHKTSYTLRSFMWDVRKGLKAADLRDRLVRWEFYDKREREEVNEIVPLAEFVAGVRAGLRPPRNYHRVRYFGWAKNQHRRARLEEFGVEDVDEVEDGEERPEPELAVCVPCPLCDGDLHLVARRVAVDDADARTYVWGISDFPKPDEWAPDSGSSVSTATGEPAREGAS